MFRSFTLRIRPNKTQVAAFEYILKDNCETYNAALQERIEAWKLQRKSISLYDQQRELTQLREDPKFAVISADIQRDPIRRLDKSVKDFFRRCKAGEKPGFPRFKSLARYNSFSTGCNRPRINGSSIRIPNVGMLPFKATQKLIGSPKTVTVKRYGARWIVRLCCDIGPAPEKCVVSNPIGVDLGITNFITLSDGQSIDNPRWTRKHAARIAAANRLLARKKKRSKNSLRAAEVLRRSHQRLSDARSNFTHHVSKLLVSKYDCVIYENLNIRKMTCGKLAKSIFDAAWGELIWQITYKAEKAGKWAVPVNPRGTSIRCSGCGIDVPKTLAERQHNCICGTSLDRDHNAALNILALGRSVAGGSLQNKLLCS